jgi:hypothetical protein
MNDIRLDACEVTLDEVSQRLIKFEQPKKDAEARADFTGYVTKRVGGYEILEGSGPDGGWFLAHSRRSGGTSRKFKTLREAVEHAEREQPGRFDAMTRADPPVSEKQRRAMHAAASGNSNIGIPKKVGKEFAEADPGGKLPENKRT